jgi:hypothetical protein
MSITKEQNDAINEMRIQIQDMLAALNKLALEVGADPIPMDIPMPLYMSQPPTALENP